MLSIPPRMDPSYILLPTVRIQKEENKVANLIHLFCCHLASECSPEEAIVSALQCHDRRRNTRRNWKPIWRARISRERSRPSRRIASCSNTLEVYNIVFRPPAENDKLKAVILRQASEAQSGTVSLLPCLHPRARCSPVSRSCSASSATATWTARRWTR